MNNNGGISVNNPGLTTPGATPPPSPTNGATGTNGNVIGPVVNLAPATVFRFHTTSLTTVFIIIFLAILLSWILVSLWTRTLENFAYNTLGLDSNSSIHAFIVAFTVTIFFIVTVWVVDAYHIIPGGLEPIVADEGRAITGQSDDDPRVSSPPDETTRQLPTNRVNQTTLGTNPTMNR